MNRYNYPLIDTDELQELIDKTTEKLLEYNRKGLVSHTIDELTNLHYFGKMLVTECEQGHADLYRTPQEQAKHHTKLALLEGVEVGV